MFGVTRVFSRHISSIFIGIVWQYKYLFKIATAISINDVNDQETVRNLDESLSPQYIVDASYLFLDVLITG
jgi:hypothetical protein